MPQINWKAALTATGRGLKWYFIHWAMFNVMVYMLGACVLGGLVMSNLTTPPCGCAGWKGLGEFALMMFAMVFVVLSSMAYLNWVVGETKGIDW